MGYSRLLMFVLFTYNLIVFEHCLVLAVKVIITHTWSIINRCMIAARLQTNTTTTTRLASECTIFDKIVLNLATKIIFALGYSDKGKVPGILRLQILCRRQYVT